MTITVVLAEDQLMVLGALSTLLGLEADITVAGTAPNGEEAVRLVATLEPDVLLTDIEMPGMTGLEVAAEVRRRGLPTRVVILTTFARSGYLRRALDAGAVGYLLKDAPASALAQAVRDVHAGGRAIDPELAADAWGEPDPLTDRETEILRLMAGGYSNKEIANSLGVAEGTVKNHVSNILSKMGVRDRTRAVLKAFELGQI